MTTAASVQQSANGHLATGECQPKRTNTVFTMLALLLSTALYFILLEIYFHYYLTYPRLTKSSTTPSTCPRRRLSDCRQLRRHVHIGDCWTVDNSVDMSTTADSSVAMPMTVDHLLPISMVLQYWLVSGWGLANEDQCLSMGSDLEHSFKRHLKIFLFNCCHQTVWPIPHQHLCSLL